MADDTRGPGNGLLYALLGALSVVVASGGCYICLNSQDPPVVSQAAPPAAPTATPTPAPAPAPAPQRGRSGRSFCKPARAGAGGDCRRPADGRRAGTSPAPRWRCRAPTVASPAWPRPRPPGARSPTCGRRAAMAGATAAIGGRTPRASPPWSTPHERPLPDATTAPPTARSTKPSASMPEIPPWSARATSSWKHRPVRDDGTIATDLRRLAAKKKPTRFQIGWASQRA